MRRRPRQPWRCVRRKATRAEIWLRLVAPPGDVESVGGRFHTRRCTLHISEAKNQDGHCGYGQVGLVNVGVLPGRIRMGIASVPPENGTWRFGMAAQARID